MVTRVINPEGNGVAYRQFNLRQGSPDENHGLQRQPAGTEGQHAFHGGSVPEGSTGGGRRDGKHFSCDEENQALLVCGYEEEDKFKALQLEMAISFAEFQRMLPTLPKDKVIIFYCA